MSDHLKRLREILKQFGRSPGVIVSADDLRALIADYEEAVRVLEEWHAWYPTVQEIAPDGLLGASSAVLAKAGGK